MSVACAFLGLGVMGGPMARHLGAAGHQVAVWNRSEGRSDAWAKAGGRGVVMASAGEAAAAADIVFMCLGDDPDVEAVFDAIEGSLRPRALVVDHTTASPGLARRLAARCAATSRDFLDAPVSGGQKGAETGQLTVMAGGSAEAFARAEPVMKAYARQSTHIGEAGSGQLAKCVNQICIAGLLQGLAEGLHFARASGLDEARVIAAISKGAAQSWQMENRWSTMVEDRFDFGFAVDWMRKDLRIALEAARENGASTPVTALIDQFYADLQARGGGRLDTSSLIRRLNRSQP